MHGLAGGREMKEEEEFRRPMLELAMIYRAEDEYVRRWLEEEKGERDLGICEWLNGSCGGAGVRVMTRTPCSNTR